MSDRWGYYPKRGCMAQLMVAVVWFLVGWFAASFTAARYIREGPLLDNPHALDRAARHIAWRPFR